MVHELAHIMLHVKDDGENLTREVKEMEAEAVAFVVMNHFGLEIKSDKYLALYKESYDLKKSLDRISNVSQKILAYLKQNITEEAV
ncbi:hypothetical protein [Halarsenatibacter silvermanii]|uniref:IrrE N-terminal-like domain-containing protein n=1 Tax=Halarsenatibacter silvermanii TaxID=321763 RepID=A0A1G9RVG2_9FIRM|nr:hypothetical protein [Halarsenatibacter silvermanii]SDM27152.1 hypothetical protein SAMN04488692_12420 [Halarsenatibacter silvermanii]